MGTGAAIPLADKSIPFLGHALPLLRDPLGFMSSLPDHGSLVTMRMGPLSVVMVCDPELARQVLLDDRTYDMGGPVFDRARESVGGGLGTCPHSEHRRQRRLCQPAFHRSRMPAYATVMSSACDAMTTTWQDGQTIDLSAEAAAMALRVNVESMFATALPRVAQDVADDFVALSRSVFWRIIMPPLINRLPTPVNRRYFRARKRLFHTVGQIIAARRQDTTDHGDLLSSLMSAQDPDSEAGSRGLSDREITEQVLTFFFAGAETTAATLAWALYQVSRHPHIEQRLQAEVDEVVGDGPATHDHLPRLPLTERVITETLRLYAPAWLGSRIVAHDTELGGYHLPAGTQMVWSPYLIHRRPDIYKNVDGFDPDRWLHTKAEREAYFPFGAGARKCIADRFALNTAILSLATISARWTLRPVTDEPFKPVVRTLLVPHGLRMRLAPRARVTA
ncbi:cytochrome P450 [Streptomyces marincola]|uniref:cytochrome P450 n=1 Tax=Streptomyces marincola TaxID=2878388 RepID=UPI001CF58AD6|nr:cytochrome P450 [Streptomyces marincola]UCM86461.1 cytochrome P450 [Streptomyces marincola]